MESSVEDETVGVEQTARVEHAPRVGTLNHLQGFLCRTLLIDEPFFGQKGVSYEMNMWGGQTFFVWGKGFRWIRSCATCLSLNCWDLEDDGRPEDLIVVSKRADGTE